MRFGPDDAELVAVMRELDDALEHLELAGEPAGLSAFLLRHRLELLEARLEGLVEPLGGLIAGARRARSEGDLDALWAHGHRLRRALMHTIAGCAP